MWYVNVVNCGSLKSDTLERVAYFILFWKNKTGYFCFYAWIPDLSAPGCAAGTNTVVPTSSSRMPIKLLAAFDSTEKLAWHLDM